jgi:Tfp pilus assembly PilM family ATPase
MSWQEDVVGLDIGDDYALAARIGVADDGALQLRNAGWTEYPADATDAAVAEAVKRLWRLQKLPTFTVCSCLRSRSIALKYFSYPDLAGEDLESAVSLEAEQALQLPVGDIAFDWHLNSRGEGAGQPGQGPAAEGFLVAAPRADVDRHLAILDKAGVYPVIVDVACLAVCNLFVRVKGSGRPDEATGIVHLSPKSADMALVCGGRLYPSTFFARRAGWTEGVDFLAKNIAEQLKYYEFRVGLKRVTQLVFTGCVSFPGSRDTGGADASSSPTPEQCLVAEIQKATGVPASMWDPTQALAVKNDRLREALGGSGRIGPLLAVSLGLALREN